MVGPFTVPAMSCSRQLWQQSSAAVLRSCSQACSTSAPSTDLPSSSAHLLSFARSIWYHSGRRDRLAESVPYMRARAKWKKQLKQLREQYKAEIMQKYPDPKVARKAQQQEMVTMVEERIKVAQELRRQRQERLDFKLATAQMQLQIVSAASGRWRFIQRAWRLPAALTARASSPLRCASFLAALLVTPPYAVLLLVPAAGGDQAA